MILETDQALLAVTKARVLGNAAVAVTFDPPARPWIQALKTPAVNFFLFDVRENGHRRDVMYEQVRDEGGKVVGHRPPALQYDLHYTVTVWGAPIAVEHRILALVLRCFGALPTLPRALLPEALAQSRHEVHLATAAGTKRGMFLNLAGEVKLGFELTATVAMPVPDEPAAQPVNQAQVTVAPKPSEAQPAAGTRAAGQQGGAETQAAETQATETRTAEASAPSGTGAPETVTHGQSQ
ncbi:MAG: Pvc16 family protein [Actinocrinis sp.]